MYLDCIAAYEITIKREINKRIELVTLFNEMIRDGIERGLIFKYFNILLNYGK